MRTWLRYISFITRRSGLVFIYVSLVFSTMSLSRVRVLVVCSRERSIVRGSRIRCTMRRLSVGSLSSG